MHELAVVELKPEKNSGLNGIRTHDLGDAGAVLYQLSDQAKWELVTLWVCNIPIDGDEYKSIHVYEIYIWTAEKDVKTWLIMNRSYTRNLSSCEIKAWQKFRPELASHPWLLQCRFSASQLAW